MKILKVEFENINSLAGHWCIDFQDESYNAAHNIFVICGPTGAGKTTILDAITLAIFGKTPRQTKINKSENEIMTRETTSCFARVTYECETGTYVSEWYQRYGRPTKGKPSQKQDPGYKISRIADDGSLEIISEGKQSKDALGEANSKIIKLDYTQFCRSIMLAQGEFNKFLTSTENERAAILEKLDGSEKYRTVAARVYERYRKERDIYDNLNAQMGQKQVLMKSQEELLALTEERNNSNSELKTLDEISKKNDSLLNWYNQLEKHQTNLNNAENEFQKADNNFKEFESEKFVLKRAIEAQNCEASYENNKKLHLAQHADETKLSENKNHEIILTDKKQECENNLNKLKANLNDLKSSFEKDSELYKLIRQDDINIQNIEKEKLEKENQKNDASKELTKLNNNIKKLNKDLEAQKKDLAEKKQYIEAHENDGNISASLPDIKVLAEQHKTAEKEISTDKANIKKLEKELKTQNKKLNELLVSEDSLMQERGNLIENNITVIVDVLQEKLSDGTPCPVCGSKNHPYCEDSNVSEKAINSENDEKVTDIAKQLKEINKQIDNIRKDKNTHTVRITGITNEIETLNGKISTAQNTLDNGFKQLEDLILPWHSEQFALSDLDDICEALAVRSVEFVEIQKAIGKLEASITAKEEALATNSTTLNEKEEKFKEHTDNLTITIKALEDLKNKRSELFGDKSVDAEEKAAKARIDKAEQKANDYSEQEKEIEKELSQTKGTINSLLESISGREKEIKESEKLFADKLKENNFDSEEAMLNARINAQKIKALQKKEEDINNRLLQTRQSLDDARAYLEKHKQEQPSIKPKNEIIEEQLTIKTKTENLRSRISQIDSTLAVNEQNRSEYQELSKRFEAQKIIYARWQQMQEWTGVKDGSDLSVFVQNITFKNLLKLANKHLSKMKDRYRLNARNNKLGLEIIDSYFADPRPDSNISGGEKFLVSLALALGIAEFASKNVHIDSLFLDEGFGSLDNEVLDDVLTCLKREQKNGKLLGIITHVDAVVQSIDQRIEVTPTINGHSRITGPGVSNG